MHPFRGGFMIGQLRRKSRGVDAESAKFRDRKGNEADIGATHHPVRVLLKLGLLSTAWSDIGRVGTSRNAEQTKTHGINNKFLASDTNVVQDTHVYMEAVVAVEDLN
jgi:hypothetical protein